jgi:hypothetical protein
MGARNTHDAPGAFWHRPLYCWPRTHVAVLSLLIGWCWGFLMGLGLCLLCAYLR